jgi:hypothetical protein
VGTLTTPKPGDNDQDDARAPRRPPSLEDRISALEAQNRNLQRTAALLRWVLLAFLTAVPA